MTRLVQIQKGSVNCVAVVREPRLRLLRGVQSTYALACSAEASGTSLLQLVKEQVSGEELDYDPIYQGKSEWRLRPPIHHSADARRRLGVVAGHCYWRT
jgi:hypothetical protein